MILPSSLRRRIGQMFKIEATVAVAPDMRPLRRKYFRSVEKNW